MVKNILSTVLFCFFCAAIEKERDLEFQRIRAELSNEIQNGLAEVEKEGDQKIIVYSFGKKKGSIEIEENFYDNLTLQIQIKMNYLKKDKFKINYFDKGKIKIKSFLNKKEEIIYKSKPVEVFEFTEQREDKRYFKFLIRNDSDKETIKVFQGGRGFNVDWELD